METAFLAAGAMVVQDVLAVMMVQAEARNRGILAGALDSISWICTIATTSISVTTLQGNNLNEKILVIASVTIANMLGSVIGVYIGSKYIKDKKSEIDWDAVTKFINEHEQEKSNVK